MECKRCGNKDNRWFHEDKKGIYCRKCIMFGRVNLQDGDKCRELKIVEKETKMQLSYPLTKAQLQISSDLIEMIKQQKSGLVYAACGAGKTEIVMPVIEYCINHKLRIGFAISRREVVLEITMRLQSVFPNLEVVPVCEGYTEIDEGDVIVCTTHQLYRYPKSFDVLILDEIDAFPYAGNETLSQIAMKSVKASIIYLTATPDHNLMKRVERKELMLFELFVRPHQYPLIVPKVKRSFFIWQCWRLLFEMKKMQKDHKPVLVFVPTISWTVILQKIFSFFFKVGSISSKTNDKEQVMRSFQSGELEVLVSTTILERGITIEDVQVYVLMGEHVVFREASLIQMIGRVGRKKEHPSGEAIIYCRRKTPAIKKCVKTLRKMNTYE